jgi:hypothetical protein
MNDENQTLSRPLANALRAARLDLDAAGSVRDRVAARVAHASMRPPSHPLRAGLAIAASIALLAAAGASFWPRPKPATAPPHLSFAAPTPSPDFAQASRLDVGGAELIEHLAATVDHRAVVVLWSCRGVGVTVDPDDDNGAERPHRTADGKYRRQFLRQDHLPDGRTLVLALFIPDPGVRPTLEPPLLRARLPDGTAVAFAPAPRPASAREIAHAMTSAGLSATAGGPVDDFLRQIRNANP